MPIADPGALAAALDSVVVGGTAAANFARSAGARAERFTADAHAVRCLEVYQQVLDRDTRTSA